MKGRVNPEDVSLESVWIWWWFRSRKPGTKIEVPPMPPLEEWPKEILKTFERLTGVSLKDAKLYDPQQ